MRYRLRTLMILLAVLPPVLGDFLPRLLVAVVPVVVELLTPSRHSPLILPDK